KALLSMFVLVTFAVVFVALTVSSYRQESATVDEPMNLAGGYVALTRGDYHITCQNEFLTRLWCALPLLSVEDIVVNEEAERFGAGQPWVFAHRFLYQDNDADALLYRARFMTVLFGVALGCVLFCWAYEWFGLAVATCVLGMYCAEPNILAHSRLV